MPVTGEERNFDKFCFREMGKDSKAKGGAKGGDAKGGAKGGKGEKKGAEAVGAKEKGGGCSSINVRHILCEKQGKCMEAMAKLQAGERLVLTTYM